MILKIQYHYHVKGRLVKETKFCIPSLLNEHLTKIRKYYVVDKITIMN